MAINHEHGSGAERNPSVGYDRSDLGSRGILIFFLVLAVFAVGVHLCVLGMYVSMTKITDKHDPEMSPLAPKAITPRAGILTNTANVNIQQFPEPRLARDDTAEMERLLLKETASLTAAPWTDAQGNVHLPIEQAMKEFGARLPVREGGAVVPKNYPGAGREYAGRPAVADEGQPQEEPAESEVENPAASK